MTSSESSTTLGFMTRSIFRFASVLALASGLALTLTILSLDTLGRTLARVLEDRHEIAIDAPAERPAR